MKLKSPPLITGVLLDFEDSKCITFRINVIPLPASTGLRELWQCNGSTKPEYRSLGRVVTFGLKRADKRIRAARNRRFLRWSSQ